MTLERLKKDVCEANLRLVREGLVTHTWGNASGVDRGRGVMVIKPSGVPYAAMTPRMMVVVDLRTGRTAGGKLRPSSDTPTHLTLYRAFPAIGGVVHTHSPHATAWAQARRGIPALGTTHADYFGSPVPCTRALQPDEIAADYETNTGKVIVECFKDGDPLSVPAVLVACHAPFTWGVNVAAAVENAVVLEAIASMAAETLAINASACAISGALLNKHFERKHGPKAYYGQPKAKRRTAGSRPRKSRQ
jgi:L-ribulose-5-phosphate 4-epimerase